MFLAQGGVLSGTFGGGDGEVNARLLELGRRDFLVRVGGFPGRVIFDRGLGGLGGEIGRAHGQVR